jgi:mono/diheme cytochrome c family protein
MRRFLLGFILGISTPLILGLVGAQLGYFPIDAKATPPVWEAALASPAVAASVARQAPRIMNPVAPTEANLLEGVRMFKDMCAGCHGDPNGESPFGAGFYPRTPQFATHAPTKPDWQLFWIVKNGVRYTGMPSWERLFGPTGDEKIWKMVTFLSHLDSLPPAVREEWNKKPAQ